MKTLLLYIATAIAEIGLGCYLPWLWLKHQGSVWLLLPAAASLGLFAWLLTLHDAASGSGLCCLRWCLHQCRYLLAVGCGWIRPSIWDVAGVAVALAGMGIIAFQPR